MGIFSFGRHPELRGTCLFLSLSARGGCRTFRCCKGGVLEFSHLEFHSNSLPQLFRKIFSTKYFYLIDSVLRTALPSPEGLATFT